MRILFIIIFFVIELFAHQTGLSFLEVIHLNGKKYSIVYKKPLSDTRVGDISIIYPNGCFYLYPFHTKIENGFIIKTTQMECSKDSLKGNKIWIEGLVKSDRGVLVYYKEKNFQQKAILRSTSPFLAIVKETSKLEIAKEYISLGISHILMGYDHLMFVLLLLLLAKNLKQLFYTVTAFTLSHSITLTCSVLDLIYLPSAFVEMMIALSIIFLAKELQETKETLTKVYLPISSFSFGLLHGFGFSSALKDIGLPPGDIPLSLFSFNIGIEIGQIIFIMFCLSFIAGVWYLFHIDLKMHKKKIAYVVGVLASFWFWQRFLSIF